MRDSMDSQAELVWLTDWVSTHSINASEDLENMVEENYLQSNIINSFGLIELILESEQHFSIKFDNKNFEDPRFTSFKGLAEIIHEIRKAGV